MENIDLLIIYNGDVQLLKFKYFGKIVQSTPLLHSPRWSLKNISLNITQKKLNRLQKASTFTLNNFYKKRNGKISFEIIGKREYGIYEIIEEVEQIDKRLAKIVKSTLPYRIELRTTNNCVNTQRKYIDFHLFLSPVLWDINLTLSKFAKFEKLPLFDIDYIKILWYTIKEGSCNPKLVSKVLKIPYHKTRRIIHAFWKSGIFLKIGNSPAIFVFSSNEVKRYILQLLIALDGLINSI